MDLLSRYSSRVRGMKGPDIVVEVEYRVHATTGKTAYGNL